MMVDEDIFDIEKKFSLDDSENEIFSVKKPMCKVHSDAIVTFRCAICMFDYCEKCKKILRRNKIGMEKVICKKCWKIFLIKTIIFLLTSIISIGSIYYFQNLHNLFGI